jgi:hypothetical protein
MIDKVKMSTIVPIPTDLLENDRWHPGISKRTGDPYYTHLHYGLTVHYYPHSQRLIIDGRLITASIQPDAVTNLDALLAGISEVRVTQHHIPHQGASRPSYGLTAASQNITEFIIQINQYLSDLVGSPIDILYFHVTKIEICFNVQVDHVEQYIELFNLIFFRTDPSHHTNFVLVKNKPIYSSFYIKSNSDFRDYVRRGVVINFYNKKDQLKNKMKAITLGVNKEYSVIEEKVLCGQPISHRSSHILSDIDDRIGLDDAVLAQNNLRMEVQLHYKALYDLLGTEDRSFGLFLNIDYCREIVARQYAKKLRCTYDHYLDFCSLKTMREIIDHSELSNTIKRNLSQSITEVAQNHTLSPSQFYTHKRRMEDLGMHWYPIPARFHVDRLVSPIRLLDQQIDIIKHARTTYEDRRQKNQLEVDMYASIEEGDDGMVIVED